MTKTLGDYLVLILTITGSFASIIAFGTYFAPLLDTQGWVGVLFLGFIALLFLCYNFYLVLRYRKKVRYAEVFEEINIGFASLHQIDRPMNRKNLLYGGFYVLTVPETLLSIRISMLKF